MAKIYKICQKISPKPPPSCYQSFLRGNEISAKPFRFRDTYDDSIGSAKQFNTSSGYSDKLLWAATCLYRATNDEYYMKYVVDSCASLRETEWSVKENSRDKKYAGVQMLLSKVDMDFVQCNIWNLRLPGRAIDTVVMNPSFGTRKKGADMEFLSVALKDELLWAATWIYRATNDEYYLKYFVDNCASLAGTGWSVKEWAARWLYRATSDEYYLKYVVDNCASLGGTGWSVKKFSWDNKYAGIQILLSKILVDGAGGAYTSTLIQYQAKADYFTCACLQKNAPPLLYSSSAAFLLAGYFDYLAKEKAIVKCLDAQLQPQDLPIFAKSQADYILGKSMSYLVGFGQKYPVHVHHRLSSIELSTLIQSVLQSQAVANQWQLPKKGKLKFNVDAAFKTIAAIGGIIRDDQGNPKLSLQRRLDNVLHCSVAEMLGIFFAIKTCIAKRIDLKDIIFEVDSREVWHTIMVKGIRKAIGDKLKIIGKGKKDMKIVHLLYQQIGVLKMLDSVIPPGGVVVELISRNDNTLADALAKDAFKLGIRRYLVLESD